MCDDSFFFINKAELEYENILDNICFCENTGVRESRDDASLIFQFLLFLIIFMVKIAIHNFTQLLRITK